MHEFTKQNDPKAMVDTLVKLLKQQNPAAQSSVMTNEKSGDVIIDFTTWPKDNAYVEFSIFRYSKKPGGGVAAQQYSLRSYKDQKEFLTGLKKIRERVIPLMAADGLKIEPAK